MPRKAIGNLARKVSTARGISALCVFLLALSIPLAGFALRIDTPKIVTQLGKDKSYSGEINVENNSDHETKIKAYMEDFLYTEPFNGDKNFLPPGSNSNSVASWVTMSPLEFTLSPFAHRTVNFIIRAPKDITIVHHGVIFFESAMGSTINDKGESVQVLGRVGTLVFINPLTLNKKSEFLQIIPNTTGMQGLFKNIGNTFLHVQPSYYIVDKGNIIKDRGVLADLYLLPQDSTKISLAPSVALPTGSYTAVITFDLDDGDVAVKEIDFSVSPQTQFEILSTRD